MIWHDKAWSGKVRQGLNKLLSGDLDFHGEADRCNLHSFPARFPPALPRTFIEALSGPGSVVLDPMMGSGTTVMEAALSGRRGIGVDMDPLARLIARARVTPVDPRAVERAAGEVLDRAASETAALPAWDAETQAFAERWFTNGVRRELAALAGTIRDVSTPVVRDFLWAAFSAIIITKGGVSAACDLAHTRPQRAKVIYDRNGRIIEGAGQAKDPSRRVQILTKRLKSPLAAFKERVRVNVSRVISPPARAAILAGSALSLPLRSGSVDLVVTSPPYAAHAIDYLRAHKFSLIWMGWTLRQLRTLRRACIGAESIAGGHFEDLPPGPASAADALSERHASTGTAVARYYAELARAFREIARVLKPGGAAVLVVGDSVLRGMSIRVPDCIAEIGQAAGLEGPIVGVRALDRNRRMLPVGNRIDAGSPVQRRMHEEHVLGFWKSNV